MKLIGRKRHPASSSSSSSSSNGHSNGSSDRLERDRSFDADECDCECQQCEGDNCCCCSASWCETVSMRSLIVVLAVLPYALVTITVLKPWLGSWRAAGQSTTFASVCLARRRVASHTRATTAPHALVGFSFLVLVLWSYFRCSMADPGFVTERIAQDAARLPRSQRTFCRMCDIWRPVRSHHCRSCKQW